MQNIHLIGISDESQPSLSLECQTVINQHSCFAGATRHFQLIKELLPQHAQWFNVEVPLATVINKINETDSDWVIFASGDPLFFGLGNTLKREVPLACIKVYPTMNSLQMLAHRLQVNYGEYRTLSLTGRPWSLLDTLLIQGESRMGILTDKQKTPSAIAQRMVNYGYKNYRIHIGEHLGGDSEKLTSCTINEACSLVFDSPNCLLLEKVDDTIPTKGIPEHEFSILPGRPKMITKMPIRLTTLALMELQRKTVLWDVGSCTGSIAIETRLWSPHIQVIAFEKRLDSRAIISDNASRFGTPGIEMIIDDFCTAEKSMLPQPDAIFLGGYGGEMEKILNICDQHLKPDGTLAFNAVSNQSCQRFEQWLQDNAYTLKSCTTITVDDNNPITIMIGEKQSLNNKNSLK